MMRILRILIVVWIYLLISAMSYGAIELGEVVDKLYADLDGDLRQEVIILRRAKLPLKGERVEIWRSEQEQDPAFASDWKEVVEPKVLRMSAKGELSLETVGNRVLVKYIWREFGEGTGAGHEHEQLIYYGYVDKKGNWCIIEDNSTNGTYRYASGDEEYKRQWNLRTKLSYVYFHEL